MKKIVDNVHTECTGEYESVHAREILDRIFSELNNERFARLITLYTHYARLSHNVDNEYTNDIRVYILSVLKDLIQSCQ